MLRVCIALFFINAIAPVAAQPVLFDFDNAPIYTSLPINQTAGSISAHLTATGQGYSIQDANVLGFTPPGFAGHIIYPNSINLSDLLIGFDQTLTFFSIMYSCQELGCDDAATIRVTAFMNGSAVGTNTRTATFPGTWPVDTLSCTFTQGFDSVVVHYDSHPPLCQDYGVIYLADNMWVTTFNTGIANPLAAPVQLLNIPNPVSQSATVSFSLLNTENITVAVYNTRGTLIRQLFNGRLNAGIQHINCKVNDMERGVYLLTISNEHFLKYGKLVVVN